MLLLGLLVTSLAQSTEPPKDLPPPGAGPPAAGSEGARAPGAGFPGGPPELPIWSVGAGAIVATRPYGGGRTRVVPIPVIRYQGERLTVEGPFARYRLAQWENVRFTGLLRYRFDGYESDDGDVLDGMERDDTLDAGVRSTIRLKGGTDIRLDAVTDLLGRHEGVEIGATIGRTFRTGSLFIVPEIGVQWQSSNLADYYFGVRPEEARPGRPAYTTGSALNLEFGLTSRYLINRRTALVVVLRQRYLDESITDSPIVDENFITSFIVSLTYSL
ncbi:MAG: MipA/OmpV family protein [Planctomycetota bacterium]